MYSCSLTCIPLQTSVLDEAARLFPCAWWWVKEDGTDVGSGLSESTRGKWSGDVDLNDGTLQHSYEAYQQHLELIEQLGVGERAHLEAVAEDLLRLSSTLKEELDFVIVGKCILYVKMFMANWYGVAIHCMTVLYC